MISRLEAFMARPLVLSNGSLHVGINKYGLVHDFYYPYVGLENHSAGQSLRHKIGVWIDGQLSWMDDESWKVSFSSATTSLVGHVKARHDGLQVLLEFDDFVDATNTIFFRNIHVINLADTEREIRVFMHQAFVIGDSRSNTDTAQYLPSSHAILHYRGNRCFVVSGKSSDDVSFDQHSIGLFGIEGREGTYRDAEDGELQNGNVEHGRVDSTLRFVVQIKPHSSERLQYWISAGKTLSEAIKLHKIAKEHGLQHRLRDTIAWWNNWIEPAEKVANKLPKEYRSSFLRSTILIKSHIDNNGAIIASTDSGMLKYWRDAYSYFWPRDGVYAIWPLMRMGYTEEVLNFFAFCKDVVHPSGYLMHKYRADKALGSSWHPYQHDGNISAPPIQEDETAAVVFLFCQFHLLHTEPSHIETYYSDLIKPMADFLAEYVDEKTHLPKPSYDLWEENFLTTTYTTSLVQAALFAVADLAESVGDSQNAVKWRSVADDMREAALKLLFNHKDQTFRKGILATKDTIVYRDEIDAASFYGAFMYGLVSSDSAELKSMYTAVVERLGKGSITKIPRYEDDAYMRPDNGVSNAWYITALWLSQYQNEVNDEESRNEILKWTHGHMSSTGMLSEQVAVEGEHSLSVSPLMWSHAEYLSTLLDGIVEARS
jgi:GH15 family glucan-1,4-alpha-glucosidase